MVTKDMHWSFKWYVCVLYVSKMHFRTPGRPGVVTYVKS